MKGRGRAAVGLVAALLLAGCTDNTAPGNDRESELDPLRPAAEVASVEAAIGGVAAGVLKPRTLTDADMGSVPSGADRCRFRYTRVGLPVFAYATTGVLKLNDRLIVLPPQGEGRWGTGGLDVTLRALEGGAEEDGPFAAELVVRLPGAPDELGFHGYAEC